MRKYVVMRMIVLQLMAIRRLVMSLQLFAVTELERLLYGRYKAYVKRYSSTLSYIEWLISRGEYGATFDDKNGHPQQRRWAIALTDNIKKITFVSEDSFYWLTEGLKDQILDRVGLKEAALYVAWLSVPATAEYKSYDSLYFIDPTKKAA